MTGEDASGDAWLKWIATLCLGGAMASHQIAETARDALFLEELGAERLPFAYGALAVVGVAVAWITRSVAARKLSAAVVLLVSVPICVAFWWLCAGGHPWVFGALYVWTGTFAILFVSIFWLGLSHRTTVSEAKVLFPTIAAGGIAGALIGAIIAREVANLTHARHLLLLSGGPSLLAAPLAWVLGTRVSPRVEAEHSTYESEGFWSTLRTGHREPFVRQLGAMLLLSSMTLTLLDYTFKSVLVNTVAGSRLASALATFYAAVNAVGFVSQVLVTRWAIMRAGLWTVLLVVPALILGGGIAVGVAGGLGTALVLKGVDGGLKHSLHRTTSELLFMPVQAGMRNALKPFMDVLGKRGGQALGSIIVLVLLHLGATDKLLGLSTAAGAMAWLVTATLLRFSYIDIFRRSVRRLSLGQHVGLPELQVGSFRALLLQLNDESPTKVNAAMELLVSHGQADVIPDLILYHPSPQVLLRALTTFTRQRRRHVAPLARQLLMHPEGDVQAAATVFLAAVAPSDEGPSGSTPVRPRARGATLTLRVGQDGDLEELRRGMSRLSPVAAQEYMVGAASALIVSSGVARLGVATWLLQQAPPRALAQLATSLAEAPVPEDIAIFVALLKERSARSAARRGLLALELSALKALRESLFAPTTPFAVRYHIPRTISLFPARQAAPILLDCVAETADDAIRHKALRGLGRVVMSQPRLRLDARTYEEARRKIRDRAQRLREVRLSLEATLSHDADLASLRRALLSMVHSTEHRSIEHFFRLAHLRRPKADIESIFISLTKGSSVERAGAEELLRYVVSAPEADEMLQLVRASRWLPRGVNALSCVDQDEALMALLGDSEPLRCTALRYIGDALRVALLGEVQKLARDPSVTGDIAKMVERQLLEQGRAGA